MAHLLRAHIEVLSGESATSAPGRTAVFVMWFINNSLGAEAFKISEASDDVNVGRSTGRWYICTIYVRV